MEDSPPLLQSLILNPSETACSFPPHHRRPLRSRTYAVLIRILSQCRPPLQMQESVSKEDGAITHSQVISTDVLALHPNSKGSEDKVVREICDAETKESTSFQDFDDTHATTPKLHQPGLVRDSKKEVISSNEISIEDYLVVEAKVDGCAVQNTKELENVNSVLDIQMDDFDTLKDVELDKDSCFDQLNEVLDSCFGLDKSTESSGARQLSQEKGTISEENIAKDVEYELQMKEAELEKLIYSSGNTEAPFGQNAGDIEEGEISRDAGIGDESFDASSEVAVLGDETTENMHASEGYFDRDKVLCEDKGRRRQQHGMSDPSPVNIVNIESNSKNVKNGVPAGQLQEYHYLDVPRESHTKTPKSSDTPHGLDSLTPPERILQANAAENQNSMTTDMDEDAGTKKRKRTLTKERRAKRKKKERLKRAEKNRELGVKRLKLPTILKPKKIVYCRHYLQGRCHEGEKCKFSHDTVPLTKSKPCGHFARHSCMIGDDCPFDHQLSKYPCNNYTENGFCSRGSDCMFSHEMLAKSPSVTPNVSKHDLISPQKTVPEKGPHPMSKVHKSELKSPSPLNNPNSNRPMDSCGTSHQKVNSRLCATANSASQREQLASKPFPGTGGGAPRGVSFLLNGALPLGDTDKDKGDGSSAKTIDGVGAGCKGTHKVPGAINELNEMSQGVAPKKPRGINFLSFGQPPSDDSSSKILSNLLSNCNDGTGKSAIDYMGEGKLSSSLTQGAGTFNANRQMNQSAINLVSGTKANGTPLAVPQNVNFLSSNRTHIDVSSSKGKANLDSSKGDTALSYVKEMQSTSELQDIIATPFPSFRGQNANLPSSFKTALHSNTPNSVRKAVQSTLAFAAQLESGIKLDYLINR